MSRVLRPLFVTVTWGAGGCTASKSLELAEICQRELGLTTCLHLTCTNMKRKIIDEALEAAKALGIRNILALRGDPPRKYEYGLCGDNGTNAEGEGDSDEEFIWAIDLVRYIRKTHGNYFCIGVAAYPEGHADESYPIDQDPNRDLSYLLEKTQAGADFIMTQLFYDVKAYLRFEEMLREHQSGVFAEIPIIPGLMPIQSFDILNRTTKLSHARLPTELLERLEGVKGDDEAVKSVGVDAISEIVHRIKEAPSARPRGFHFYTLNLEKAVGYILERCDLIPVELSDQAGSAIDDLTTTSNSVNSVNGIDGLTFGIPSHRRLSSTSSSHTQLSTSTLSRRSSMLAPDLATTHGIGPRSREATWDDYPNGRFGDTRSPAFNPTLSYSPSTLPVSASLALSLWDHPTDIPHITNLFISYLSGSAPTQLPWSESQTLSSETAVILPQLIALNSRNWWTIASQPAVDGLLSSHPIHGWGPKGGFVFQKAFVEFFVPATDWQRYLRPHLRSPSVRAGVSWYVGDSKGNFESSDREGSAAVHAVTWGMFPGKEIATATMVEEVSFRAWAEEAFGLWTEWARIVGEGPAGNRQARLFLRKCREESVLVNVIGHDFRDQGRLWEILAEAGGGGK